jgi:hypothetical protein
VPVARVQWFRPLRSNPFDSFSDLDLLLYQQEGVISRRQARRWLSSGAIRHRLVAGVWQQVHWGVYLTREVQALGDNQQRMIASLAAGNGQPAPLGGRSALQMVGLRGFAAVPVHVLLPGRLRDHDPPPFAVVHRTRLLQSGELHRTTSPPCTVAGRAVVDAAQWAASDHEAAILVAAAFQQRLVGIDDLTAALARQPRARRRALVADVAHDAAGGAHSLPEIEYLRLCRRAGLPTPTCQVIRADTGGRRRYLDAYFDEYAVHVEIDGGQHTEAATWWADMKRQNELWVAGDRVLRFPAWVVRTRPAEVAAQTRAALMAAGWRHRPRDLGRS